MTMVKIIDVNCMVGFWPNQKLRFHDAAGLLAEMDSYRISQCVAYHSYAHNDLWQGNGQMRKIADDSAGKIKACYVLRSNLDSAELPDGAGLLKRLRDEKPVAVKLFPNTHRYLADEFYCGELFEVLNELKIPVMFDCDQKPAYDKLPVLAKAYPGIRFILLRQNLNESRYTLPLLRKTENVFFDTSTMIDAGLIDEIVGKYGSERLLFGSAMPFFVPAGGFGMIFYARISDRDKENILSANWMRLEGSIAWK
jgi:hypothetical protein